MLRQAIILANVSFALAYPFITFKLKVKFTFFPSEIVISLLIHRIIIIPSINLQLMKDLLSYSQQLQTWIQTIFQQRENMLKLKKKYLISNMCCH